MKTQREYDNFIILLHNSRKEQLEKFKIYLRVELSVSCSKQSSALLKGVILSNRSVTQVSLNVINESTLRIQSGYVFNLNKHCEVLVSCSDWVDWIDFIELHDAICCHKHCIAAISCHKHCMPIISCLQHCMLVISCYKLF